MDRQWFNRIYYATVRIRTVACLLRHFWLAFTSVKKGAMNDG
ncbi:hypothetical protein LBMAG46_42080 [Planctomycetia bacterium]|nr:hypothetical protein LBMAG46_42080 [Planctomycetia bacterium]